MLLQAKCVQCGADIDYDAEDIGKTINCPICAQPTPLWKQTSETAKAVQSARVKKKIPRAVWIGGSFIAILIIASAFGYKHGPLEFIIAIACLLGAVCIYFLPTIAGRDKENASAIFLLNLFLGWTFIGWVVALVWAATRDKK